MENRLLQLIAENGENDGIVTRLYLTNNKVRQNDMTCLSIAVNNEDEVKRLLTFWQDDDDVDTEIEFFSTMSKEIRSAIYDDIINSYAQHREYWDEFRKIEKECEKDLIALVNNVGGEIELPYDDDENWDVVLSCYDNNGDAYNTTITKVKVCKNFYGDDFIQLETNVGGAYSLDRFVPTSVFFVYENVWRKIHNQSNEDNE